MIWALVAGTAVFWGLRLLTRAPEAPAHAVPVGPAVAVRGDLARLLGATPVETAAAAAANPEASTRFRLLGVMAPKGSAKEAPSGQGVALIAVDGKPPKAFIVGARLDNDLVLQAVSLRTASIGPPEGAATVKLEIPPLPPPATGTLPPGLPLSGGAPPVQPVAVPAAAPPVVVAPIQPPQVPQIPPPTIGSQPVPPAPAPVGPAGSPLPRRDVGAASR